MGAKKKNAQGNSKRLKDVQQTTGGDDAVPVEQEKSNMSEPIVNNHVTEKKSTTAKQKSSVSFYLFLFLLTVVGGISAVVFTNDDVRASVGKYAIDIIPENVLNYIVPNLELFKKDRFPKPRIYRTREPIKEPKSGDNGKGKEKDKSRSEKVHPKTEKRDDDSKKQPGDKVVKKTEEIKRDDGSKKSPDDKVVKKTEEIKKPLKIQKKEEPTKEKKDAKKKSLKKDYAKISITNDYDYKIRKKLDAAEDLTEKEKFSEAIAAYDNIMDKHPRSVRALFGKGRSLNSLSEIRRSNQLLEEAIEVLDKILSLPNVPKELMIKAGLLLSDRQVFRGWSGRSSKTLKVLTNLYPDDVELKNKLGVSYLMTGKNDKAREIYKEVLRKDPQNGFAKVHLGFIIKVTDDKPLEAIPLLKEGLFSEQPGTNDGRFYFHLGDALQRTNRTDEAYDIYKRGAERKVFLSAYQRSLYNVDRLTGKPWWTPEQSGYLSQMKKLKANWKIIRDEGLAQLDPKTGAFEIEDENLREKGEWKQLTLYQRGKRNKKNCEKTPKTCALLEEIPDATSCTRGQIKFSVMHPGVHVWPHCGPTNCRIRAHLGLKIPDGPRIRVGNETRQWTEGKFIIIDDSFEHEVWHDGTELRLILIVDFWHPELTAKERQTLSPI